MLNVKWCTQIIHDHKLASQGRSEIICVEQRVEQHSRVFSLIDSFVRFLLTTIQFQTQWVKNIVQKEASMKCCNQTNLFSCNAFDCDESASKMTADIQGKFLQVWGHSVWRAVFSAPSAADGFGRWRTEGLAVMVVPHLSTSCAGRHPAVCPVALK